MIRVQLAKRPPLANWWRILLPVFAVITTMILSAIPILIAGGNLWESYYYLFYGALGTRFNLLETFVKSSPLVLTGLAVAFAFRAKFWNIGAEGQLLAGGLIATWIGVNGGGAPALLLIPAMMIGGFLGGGAWAAVPALLKTKLKVDDVVSTLLLNFVILHAIGALLFGPLQAEAASWPVSEELVEAAHYPQLLARSRFHLGIPIAFVAILIVWFINARTVFGYRSRAVGVNIRAAHYGGINTTSVILKTALISGGLAGLAGVGEVAAIHYHLSVEVSAGYGYTGIVIAMLGNLHPIGVGLAAVFFSIVNVGSQTMSRMTGVPSFISGVIEGLALIVMLIFLLMNEYKVRVVRK